MHPDWRKFLQQQGALFDSSDIVDFHDQAGTVGEAVPGALLVDLACRTGLIAVSGPERREFLQGQVSTDVRLLTPSDSQFSSWNNAKGRVLATLRIFERDNMLMLALPSALAHDVDAGLHRYVLRSKVQIADASNALAQFGVLGATAPGLLAQCGYPVADKCGGVTGHDGVQLIRLHGTTPRVAIYGAADALQALWTQLQQLQARPAGSNAWTLHRILAGEPCVQAATSGHFVAQMLGLEELGAVHFNKGCYLGQEVIARAHYRGTVKRHLYRGSCASSESILPAMEIKGPDRQLAVGEIVDACRDAQGTWQMLAVLQQEARLSSCSVQGAALTWHG